MINCMMSSSICVQNTRIPNRGQGVTQVQMWEKPRNTKGRLLYIFLLKIGPQNFRLTSFLNQVVQPVQWREPKEKQTTKVGCGGFGGKPCGGQYFLELEDPANVLGGYRGKICRPRRRQWGLIGEVSFEKWGQPKNPAISAPPAPQTWLLWWSFICKCR